MKKRKNHSMCKLYYSPRTSECYTFVGRHKIVFDISCWFDDNNTLNLDDIPINELINSKPLHYAINSLTRIRNLSMDVLDMFVGIHSLKKVKQLIKIIIDNKPKNKPTVYKYGNKKIIVATKNRQISISLNNSSNTRLPPFVYNPHGMEYDGVVSGTRLNFIKTNKDKIFPKYDKIKRLRVEQITKNRLFTFYLNGDNRFENEYNRALVTTKKLNYIDNTLRSFKRSKAVKFNNCVLLYGKDEEIFYIIFVGKRRGIKIYETPAFFDTNIAEFIMEKNRDISDSDLRIFPGYLDKIKSIPPTSKVKSALANVDPELALVI